MTRMNTAVLVCVISAILAAHAAVLSGESPREDFDSPRLAALAKGLTGDSAGDRTAIDGFLGAIEGHGPLVEPVADDPHEFWVTFLWRGDDKTQRVNVQGGPATGESAGWMNRVGGADLWFRTERIPSDARFIYFFQVNRPLKTPSDADNQGPPAPARPDPLNPRAIPSQDGSLLELPEAPPQPWLAPVSGALKGELSEHSIESAILKQQRTFTIYTPPGYDPKGEPCRLLMLFDGGDFRRSEQIPAPVILDNLISEKKIPPIVAVLVNQTDRFKELACSDPFALFAAKELVPWMQYHYHVAADPNKSFVGGVSLGGLMAAYCGLRHSEVFGNVLSLSGAYWWRPDADEKLSPRDSEPGWLTRQFVARGRVPVRFYLAAGSFEHRFPVSLLAENRRLRDVLEAKGYMVTYRQFSGGHDYVCWRTPFVEGLVELAGAPKAAQ